MSTEAIHSLIPLPKFFRKDEGVFICKPTLTLAFETSSEEFSHAGKLLEAWLKRRQADLKCRVVDGTSDIRFVEVELEKEEAYTLTITPEQITIKGSQTGWVRATAALVMLWGQGRWNACHIEDAPRFDWRGMHLDVCRHFYPVRLVKRLIDVMALHRMNTFHWHLTDDQGWRIDIKAYPELAKTSAWRDKDGETYGGFYTADDIREVLAYAAERKIQVVPEIEMPGHALATLASFPELSCAGGPFQVSNTCGIFDDVYCAGKEATFDFLEKVLEEVCDLFPGPYIHVGGDECPKTRWKTCPDCQSRMQQEGLKDENELQSWFVSRMGQFLDSKGKHMIGWDEILEGGLPPTAIVMSWRGVAGGIEAARLGHDVIMSPTTHCYFDYRQSTEPEEPGNLGIIPIDTVYDYDPVPAELDSNAASRVLGVQANIWTERMPSWKLLEYMTLPRLCALSEVAWSPPEQKNWDNFRARLDHHLGFLKEFGYTYRHPLREKREFPL